MEIYKVFYKARGYDLIYLLPFLFFFFFLFLEEIITKKYVYNNLITSFYI